MRLVLLTSLLALGCGTASENDRQPATRTPAPAQPPPTEPAPQPVVAPAPPLAPPEPEPAARSAESCRSREPAKQVELVRPGRTVEIGERTFAYAWRWRGNDVESVLVSVDDRGELVVTPIAMSYADLNAMAVEPDAVRLISTGMDGVTQTVRVRVGPAGALHAERAVRLAGVATGWPVELVSDGRQAWLVQSLAAPDRTVSGTTIHTIDLGTARVVSRAPVPAGSSASCNARGCTVAAGAAPDTSITPRSDDFPPNAFQRSERFTHRDGVIEVSWNGGSGMMHSPTDDRGRRRYFEHWTFERGEVALIRAENGAFTAVDVVPLPLRDVNGTMHDGYTALVLRNGLHAAVLLLPEGGRDPAWFQPYRAPCPP